MEFLYPNALWFLFLLAIPIIIHLFHFRRHKTLYFSSLKFIQFVEQENKSAKKLRNLLVLIARILALTFLILAFAQPTFTDSKAKNTVGKNVVAIYIDNSFSMSAKGTEGELLSEAREMARRIINNAPLETGILLNTNKLDGIEQRIVSKMEAIEYLDKISYTPLVRKTDEVINWQKNFLEKENNEQQRIGKQQFVVLSDFQKNTFSSKQLKADEKNSYFPIQLVPQKIENVTIDSVWFSNPFHKKGDPNELFVQLRNFSDKDAANLELHLEIGKSKRDMFIDVPANKKVQTSFQFTENEFGIKTGKLTINDKQLFWDDDFYFSYNVAKKSNVLIINGKDASADVQKVFNVEPFYETSSISEFEFSKDNLNTANLLVLNGLNEIPSGLISEIVEFSNDGGSVFVLPGTNIQKSDYSNLLGELNLPSINSIANSGLKINKIQYKDPFFKGVFEKENENLNVPSIVKAYNVSQMRQSTAFTLIELKNGEPLLLRSNQNAYLFLSSLQADFSNFSSNALFPTILLRAGELSIRAYPLFSIIGKESKIPVFEEIQNDNPLKLESNTIEFIPLIQKIGNRSYLSISGMEAVEKLKPGNYSIVNDGIIGNLALNFDRSESNNSLMEKTEIIEAFTSQGIKNCNFSTIQDGQSLSPIAIDEPAKYWRILLLLSLLFILFEIALLKFWK
ncbi:MAG: hypothetical protein FGM14_11770 [Flavobacteriales bacterium]|nr:hypothetical protein [Flavobacteriales bacterium]